MKVWDKYKITTKEHQNTNINSCRASLGLSPIKKGKRLCLKCEDEFFSEDLTRNRICGHCRYGNGRGEDYSPGGKK